MSKLQETLNSRKFWLTVVIVVLAVVLVALGEIDGDKAIEMVQWGIGVYTGSLAFEDAAKRLAPGLAQLVNRARDGQADD